MDTVYRSEFRELFEVNFGRFDAKLEQRTAELKAELRQDMASLENRLTERMAALETRLLRWSFMFGIAALGAIAGMIRLLG